MIRHAFAAFALLSATLCHAAGWRMAEDASLTFKGSYQGEAFEGRFERFDPIVVFDPAALGGSRLEVRIDVTSAVTGIDDYDSTLQDADFFDSARYPQASFSTGAIRSTGTDAYEADATLTLRGKTVPFVFPFRFEIDGDRARLTATVTLKRLEFGVGGGDWADTSLIADEVEVKVDLPLTRSP